MNRYALLGVISTLFLVMGCNDASPEPQWALVPVQGKLMFQGRPVSDADVAFYRVEDSDDGYVGSSGRTNADGVFTLNAGSRKGACIGSYRVTVSKLVQRDGTPLALELVNGVDSQQLLLQGAARELFPSKYSDAQKTTLKVEVVVDPVGGAYDLTLD